MRDSEKATSVWYSQVIPSLLEKVEHGRRVQMHEASALRNAGYVTVHNVTAEGWVLCELTEAGELRIGLRDDNTNGN